MSRIKIKQSFFQDKPVACVDFIEVIPEFETLPNDQDGAGRHKCCGCAYERDYALGLEREEMLNIDIDSLPVSQAGAVRHRVLIQLS